MSLAKAVDRLIAAENRRFLADHDAVALALLEGDVYRVRLERQGVLPPLENAPRTYRCHYCEFADPDPEVVFHHMVSGVCR